MKRLEREKVIRGAYRSAILALTICCVFLGAVLVVHELAREYEVKKLNAKLDAKRAPGLYGKTLLCTGCDSCHRSLPDGEKEHL